MNESIQRFWQTLSPENRKRIRQGLCIVVTIGVLAMISFQHKYSVTSTGHDSSLTLGWPDAWFAWNRSESSTAPPEIPIADSFKPGETVSQSFHSSFSNSSSVNAYLFRWSVLLGLLSLMAGWFLSRYKVDNQIKVKTNRGHGRVEG